MSIRRLCGISLLAIVAGCNQTDSAGTLGVAGGADQAATEQQQVQAAVIQGACPPVFLRDGTAVYRSYAGRAKDDPTKLQFQATLADTTRQCRLSENGLSVTVQVQGRIVTGPAGASGTVALPIRISATDGSTSLYSETVSYQATIPADGTATQFIFTQANIALPGGSGNFTKIDVGFDESKR